MTGKLYLCGSLQLLFALHSVTSKLSETKQQQAFLSWLCLGDLAQLSLLRAYLEVSGSHCGGPPLRGRSPLSKSVRVETVVPWDLSLDGQQEHLHSASFCGLDFVTAWCLGFQGSSPREENRYCSTIIIFPPVHFTRCGSVKFILTRFSELYTVSQ